MDPDLLLTCHVDVLLVASDGQVDSTPFLCVVLSTETGHTGLTPSMDVHVTTSEKHLLNHKW